MSRARSLRRTAALAVTGALAACIAARAADTPPLRVTGMTFVGSKGPESEVVLRARHAVFFPDTDLADLEEVRMKVADDETGGSFEMHCDRGQLNIETHDFTAEGNVEGVTENGTRYSAPWVRYVHDASLLFTDAPVVMIDDTGTFTGDGFRYHLGDRRMRLLGNVRVVQE